MSSTDDNIELLELNSPSFTKSRAKLSKMVSPLASSPVDSGAKTDSSLCSHPKTNPTAKLKPNLQPTVPYRQRKRRSSKTTTEITSGSQETWDGFRERPSDDLTDSMLSSRSDARSYREKLRERFESIKKQAGTSTTKAHKSRKFMTKAEKIKSLKRNINLMKKQNQEINAELRDYEKNKVPNEGFENYISTAEVYDFFCEEHEADPHQKDANTGEPENLHSFEKSTETLIAIPEKDQNDVNAQFLPATNLNFNIRLSENELFWRPSHKHLEVAEKIETDEPRFLAEEGFFVDPTPKIPHSHLNTVEQRLLSINDKKWFNCEGKLEILKDPYSKTSYRPHMYFQSNPDLETEYVAATIDQISQENPLVPHMSTLDIQIMDLKFQHHPLFSPEHVFEQKLITFYDMYKRKLNANKLERITKRLEALRTVRNSLGESGNAKPADSKKFQNCSNEIQKLRELLFEEGKQTREILKSILQTWKIIKKIRNSNGYSNTSVSLRIVKKKNNFKKEQQEWYAKIDATCTEVISELEYDYQNKTVKYKKDIEQWKLQLQEEQEADENLSKKPKKPVRCFDEEAIRQEVCKKFQESFRPPGEPILYFSLTYDNVINDITENVREKMRRSIVATTKIYLRIICNKIEVCKSKTVLLSDKFGCFINESFSIQTSAIPQSIIVEIHEQPNTLMKRKLGEVKIRVPSQNITIHQCKATEQCFAKDELVHYKHEGVGSGVELKNIFPDTTEEVKQVLYTTGAITYKIGWDVCRFNGNGFEESTEFDVIKNVLNEDGTIDINKLVEWAMENNPDPQDPKNSVLYEYIKNYSRDFDTTPNSTKAYFRYNPEMAPLEFCDAKQIEENLRFQVLQLRNKNEPEFVGMVVPNRLKEIPLNVLTDYKRRLEDANSSSLLEEYCNYNDDHIATKRSHGQKCLKQAYTKVFQQCRNTENNLAYEDVVNEKIIPHIENLVRNIISNILSWIQLRPTINILTPTTSRKSSVRTADLNTSAKIIVSVKSALNVPLRHTGRTVETTRSRIESPSSKETTVRPFVAATYQNVSLRTVTMEGTNPVWNEDLILPLESTNTNYLSPNSLNGSILLQLFDEIDAKGRCGNVKAKNWLGSIQIPLSAISYNHKMEGLFNLQKPTELFGYKQEADGNSSARINNATQAESRATYVSLKITLNPNVPKLTQNMDDLETTELPYIKQHILKWNDTFNNEYPHRKFSALAIDTNGKTTCITRYIRPLEPPQLNTDRFDVSAEQCARYVSMIPFTDSNKFYQNVWLTTEQLLKLMVGSVIDHSVALTCYLTSLDLEAWLLLGYGLPQGTTAYVLVREYTRESHLPNYYVYDVLTATKYNIIDALCPLQKIFCVINGHNVWANIQRTDQIQLTCFDFTRRSEWLPMFTHHVTAPANSVQQKLVYSVTPNTQQLEAQIDRKIRKKVAKLRKHERTVWNHYLSRALKSATARFETGSMHRRHNSELSPDICNYSSTHSINGYIVSLPYTTISAITAAVISTGIHLREGADVEFGLAVQVYSYTNHVLAVWISLAAVTPQLSE